MSNLDDPPVYRKSGLPTEAELDHALKEIARLEAENEQLRRERLDLFKMIDGRCDENARSERREPSLGDLAILGMAIPAFYAVYRVASWCLS